MNKAKVYVEVIAKFDREGNIEPITVKWEDNTIYQIDRVLDVRRGASLKAGGSGMRYVVRIGNNRTVLYHEDPAWFVERKRS